MQIHRFIFPFPTGGKTQAASSNISPKPRWRGRDGNGVDVTPASLQRCRGQVCLGKPTAAEGSRVPALPGGPTPPPSARPAGTRLATSPGGGGRPGFVPWQPAGEAAASPAASYAASQLSAALQMRPPKSRGAPATGARTGFSRMDGYSQPYPNCTDVHWQVGAG